MDRLALSGLVLSFEGRTTRCVPRCNGKHPSPRRRSAVGVIGPRNADLPNLIMLGQLCFATHLPFSNSKTFDSAHHLGCLSVTQKTARNSVSRRDGILRF